MSNLSILSQICNKSIELRGKTITDCLTYFQQIFYSKNLNLDLLMQYYEGRNDFSEEEKINLDIMMKEIGCIYEEVEFSLEFLRQIDNSLLFINGGSAAYLHILKELKVKAPLKDIDFCLNSQEKTSEELYKFLIEKLELFCKEHSASYEVTLQESCKYLFSIGSIKIYKNNIASVELNFFINQDFTEENEIFDVIKGINVLNFDKTYDQEKYYLELSQKFINNPPNDEDPDAIEEYNMFVDKLPRKRIIVEYLEKIKK